MKTIVVWFSCGAASAVAAKRTIELYGKTHIVKIVNNPIAEEDKDNRRFLRDIEKWIGQSIEIATNSNYPDCSIKTVFDRRKYMSGVLGAPCTAELKKAARREWEAMNPHDYIVLGFTADEKKRHDRFILTERSNVLPVLIDAGITKQDCFRIVKSEGIKLPAIYDRGYPNANCIGCVKATSPTYWNLVRKQDNAVFLDRAEQSRLIGAKLARYQGKRIYLNELPEDATGRSLKSMNIDCGIFCEIK